VYWRLNNTIVSVESDNINNDHPEMQVNLSSTISCTVAKNERSIIRRQLSRMWSRDIMRVYEIYMHSEKICGNPVFGRDLPQAQLARLTLQIFLMKMFPKFLFVRTGSSAPTTDVPSHRGFRVSTTRI
jgi:hypothetical protein